MKKTNYINYLYYVLLFFNVFLALNCLTVGLNVISVVLYCLQFINVNMTVSIVSTIIIALFGILEIICILKKKFNLLKSLYIIQLLLIPLIVIGHAFYNTTEFGLILFVWIVIKIVIEIFMLKFNNITE